MSDDGQTHSFGDGHDHGPCPTCGHNPAAVTEEQVDAAYADAFDAFTKATAGGSPWTGALRAALEAAAATRQEQENT